MNQFNNPLDNVRVASPCPANWDEMYCNERKRFCAECKLNVYNLSAMTKSEAEQFLMNSEGRVCVRFYRRKDGTVLTQNCPVGWAAVKHRVSRVATAAFSMVAGFFGGLFAYSAFKTENYATVGSMAIDTQIPYVDDHSEPIPPFQGEAIMGGATAQDFRIGKAVVTPAIRKVKARPKAK